MTPTPRDARLGTTIGGKYLISSFLAEGGMGAVYAAQHIIIKRRFAVKFLHAGLTRRRDALARFRREAEAAGALESENLAAVVDFGIAHDGAPYIVMEYLDGCDLGRLLAEAGPLPVERATDIVLQACTGIQNAHAAGVIHRDLKPENLFLCRRSDGSDLVKIVDFGIAKLRAHDAGGALTGTGDVVGTAAYMSPEQARGDADLDPRTDVYALGVILYKLLSGRTPHPGDSYNAVLHHISMQAPLPLAVDTCELPFALVSVVHRALARDPVDRQASAQQLGEELLPWARRRVWPIAVSSYLAPAVLGQQSTLRVVEPAALDIVRNVVAPTLAAAAVPLAHSRIRWVLYGAAALASLSALALVLALTNTGRRGVERVAVDTAVVAATPMPVVAASTPVTTPEPARRELAPAASRLPISDPPPAPTPLPALPKPAAVGSGRPQLERGRPDGRPPAPHSRPEATKAAPKAATSRKLPVIFDTQNPYD